MANFDLHKIVTDKIIKMIEGGMTGDSWEAPWNRTGFDRPVSVATGNPYNGVNVLLLWAARDKGGYTSNTWGTFKAWQKKGYKLNNAKGKGVLIVYWGMNEKTVTDSNGNVTEEKRLVFRYSNVFNADLVEGYEEEKTEQPVTIDGQRNRIADQTINNTGAIINHGGDKAYYIPSVDSIRLPTFESFKTVEGYYSTTFHELAHWTGHKSRLDREFGKRFGDEAYAFEELIAELSAAFTCASLGVSSETRQDHAKYIKSWLKVLKNDSRAITTAASQASKASEFIIKGCAETSEKIAA